MRLRSSWHWNSNKKHFLQNGKKDIKIKGMFTVSLVTYNHHLADIREVLDAVLESSCFRFYIVDHSSTDFLGTQLSAVKDERIRYIFRENRGFGSGHNAAMKEAMAKGATFHIVLNPRENEFRLSYRLHKCFLCQVYISPKAYS